MADTGIFRSFGGDEHCDVCGETNTAEWVNIESVTSLIRLCAACAKLAGQIGEEIEPSGGGA